MKIAVTYDQGQIFQHFGHTEYFKIYEAEDGKVVSSSVESTGESGHGALAGLLKEWGVDTLICGGIGGGARAALEEAGIKLYGGASGDADQAVAAFLKGELAFDPEAHCEHHGHGHREGENCHGHGGHHGEGNCHSHEGYHGEVNCHGREGRHGEGGCHSHEGHHREGHHGHGRGHEDSGCHGREDED